MDLAFITRDLISNEQKLFALLDSLKITIWLRTENMRGKKLEKSPVVIIE
jgi:hypothetical protein